MGFDATKSLVPLVLVLLIAVAAGGCASKAPSPPPVPVVSEPAPEIEETGYAIQIGAFSVLGNAVRLAAYFRQKGEDAYYFPHESGLYKVRFGDFPTRQAALARARSLVEEGLVDVYYIVGPEDYALARSRIYGTGMLREEIIRTARGFIDLPYQWGGTSPEEGFDCSGLTKAAYQMNGINIPRSSRGQFEKGRSVPLEDVKKGDLVFFSIRSGRKVSHVGLYAGNGMFIHAPGSGKRIREDSLSNAYFQRHYVGARTYL
jgi:cell wall-associated NlpC family hydrolase